MLLKNDSTNRIHWKIARVEELILGADGKVQAAIVKVRNSEEGLTYLRRVIQHLIPIEVKSSTNNEDTLQMATDVSNQACATSTHCSCDRGDQPSTNEHCIVYCKYCFDKSGH